MRSIVSPTSKTAKAVFGTAVQSVGRGRFPRQRVILELRFASKPSKFCGEGKAFTPFGAKPPQAGSHKSLMYLTKGKELFYHKGYNFTYVGVDQTSRRSLRGASTPRFPLFGYASTAETSTRPSGSLRMTKSADGFGCMRGIIPPTLKTASCF